MFLILPCNDFMYYYGYFKITIKIEIFSQFSFCPATSDLLKRECDFNSQNHPVPTCWLVSRQLGTASIIWKEGTLTETILSKIQQCGIFLISNWPRRVQPTAGGAIPGQAAVLGSLRKAGRACHGEQAVSSTHPGSFPDFLHWTTMWKYKPDKTFPHQPAWSRCSSRQRSPDQDNQLPKSWDFGFGSTHAASHPHPLSFSFFFLWNKILLCNLDWPKICYEVEPGLDFGIILLPWLLHDHKKYLFETEINYNSQMLRQKLQVRYVTTPNHKWFFLRL